MHTYCFHCRNLIRMDNPDSYEMVYVKSKLKPFCLACYLFSLSFIPPPKNKTSPTPQLPPYLDTPQGGYPVLVGWDSCLNHEHAPDLRKRPLPPLDRLAIWTLNNGHFGTCVHIVRFSLISRYETKSHNRRSKALSSHYVDISLFKQKSVHILRRNCKTFKSTHLIKTLILAHLRRSKAHSTPQHPHLVSTF